MKNIDRIARTAYAGRVNLLDGLGGELTVPLDARGRSSAAMPGRSPIADPEIERRAARLCWLGVCPDRGGDHPRHAGAGSGRQPAGRLCAAPGDDGHIAAGRRAAAGGEKEISGGFCCQAPPDPA